MSCKLCCPQRNEEWKINLKEFKENYEFPCVVTWEGFHVIVSIKFKIYYSFKKKYTVNNLELVSHTKRFLYAAARAPSSTDDAQLLKWVSIYNEIIGALYYLTGKLLLETLEKLH